MREKLNVPSGMRHEICMASHAEMNVVTQAAPFGISLKGSSIFYTTQPCVICLKLLMSCKVKHISFKEPYNCGTSLILLERSKVKISKFEGKTPESNFIRWSW